MVPLKRTIAFPPRPERSAYGSGSANLQITITGVDAEGKLFREHTGVVRLQARDCAYHSKYKVAKDSWLMVEIQAGQGSAESWRAGAQVKGVSPAGAGPGSYHVIIELERAHEAVVIPPEKEDTPAETGETGALAGAEQPPDAAPSVAAEAAPDTVAETPAETFTVTLDPMPQATPVSEPPATSSLEAAAPSREAAPEPSRPSGSAVQTAEGLQGVASRASEIPGPLLAEMVRSAVASEGARQTEQLKAALASEVGRTVEGAMASRMSEMLEAAVARKMAEFAGPQPVLTEEVVQQLGTRLTDGLRLESTIDALAKGLTDRWADISRNAAVGAQEDVRAQLTATERWAKEKVTEVQAKLDILRTEAEGILEKSQAAVKESVLASSQAQDTLLRLGEAAKAAVPLINASLLASVDAHNAEFAKKLDRILTERAARFITEVESLLGPQLEIAEKAKEQLAEHIQTAAEELIREQETYIRELMEKTKVQVEQEIRGVLRRFAGTL